MAIDWEKLAEHLGLLTANGESSGSGEARRALELLLGEDTLRESVDYYVAYGRGRELARSVLWQLHPWSAMERCYEIFKGSGTPDARRTAVELLSVVADRRVMPWIPEFLADDDPDIQSGGIGVLDQMLFAQQIEGEEAEDLIRAAELHANPRVREGAERIRKYLTGEASEEE